MFIPKPVSDAVGGFNGTESSIKFPRKLRDSLHALVWNYNAGKFAEERPNDRHRTHGCSKSSREVVGRPRVEFFGIRNGAHSSRCR